MRNVDIQVKCMYYFIDKSTLNVQELKGHLFTMYKHNLRRKCSLMFTIALVKYAAGCMKCSSIKYIAQGRKSNFRREKV